MSAQRKARAPSSGTRNQPQDQLTQKSTRSDQRRHESDADWAESHRELGGQPARRVGSPTDEIRRTSPSATPRTDDQGGSLSNQQQDPEHPERPADGGQTEMRGNTSANESPSGDSDSPDQPKSGDRGRHPARRGEES